MIHSRHGAIPEEILERCPVYPSTINSRSSNEIYKECQITTRGNHISIYNVCDRCGADTRGKKVNCPLGWYVCPVCYPKYCVVKVENVGATRGSFVIIEG